MTLWVIFNPRGRSDASLFVRFAPKATFTNQDVIRRFVPLFGLMRRSKERRHSITSSAMARSLSGTVRLRARSTDVAKPVVKRASMMSWARRSRS
jgi:hypothetical protein